VGTFQFQHQFQLTFQFQLTIQFQFQLLHSMATDRAAATTMRTQLAYARVVRGVVCGQAQARVPE
jgi:hypothetical protein